MAAGVCGTGFYLQALTVLLELYAFTALIKSRKPYT
jgi:hypothetical protein